MIKRAISNRRASAIFASAMTVVLLAGCGGEKKLIPKTRRHPIPYCW